MPRGVRLDTIMASHYSLCSHAKWGCVCLASLLLIVYAASWGRLHHHWIGGDIALWRGSLIVGSENTALPQHPLSFLIFLLEDTRAGWVGSSLPRISVERPAGLGSSTYISVPLLTCLLLTLVIGSYLFWRDRHRVSSGCWCRCGYNLTGNVSGYCPECGAVVENAPGARDCAEQAARGGCE